MVSPIRQFIVDGFRDDPDSMAVVEQLVQNYFDKYMSPEIDRARSQVYKQQADFLKQPTGFLYAMADASHPAHFEDRLTRETLLGGYKDLFKSPEDMVHFCKRQLRMNLEMGRDMTLMTEAWRHSALIQIGQEEYDRISKILHQDLAVVYMDYRLSEMILKKMIDEQAPQSSIEYVFRKACEGSLFGLAHSLNKTPMQRRIDEEADQRLNPSDTAKNTASVLSVAIDAPMCGVMSSLGSLIGLSTFEIGLNKAQPVIISLLQGETQEKTIEQLLSERMFNTKKDVFAKMRTQKLNYITETNVINTLAPRMNYKPDLFLSSSKASMDSGKTITTPLITEEGEVDGGNAQAQESVFTQNPYAAYSGGEAQSSGSVFTLNPPVYSPGENTFESQPSNPPISTNPTNPTICKPAKAEKPKKSEGKSTTTTPSPSTSTSPSKSAKSSSSSSSKSKTAADKTVESPSKSTLTDGGNEERKIDTLSELEQSDSSSQATTITSTTSPSPSSTPSPTQSSPSTSVADQNGSSSEGNISQDEDREMASQWAPLIGQFGLNDLKHVGANLGLILATLPDMLFGMFGKKDDNPEYSWSKNLIPIASLLLGFKFNNPILKMLLVGYGGVGLIKNSMDNISSNEKYSQYQESGQSLTQRQVQFVPYPEQTLNPRIENLQINNNILVMDIDRVPYSVTLPEAVVMAYKSKSLPLSTLANAVLQKYDEAVQAMAQNEQNQLNESIHRYNPQMDLNGSEHEAVTLK